MHRRSHRIIIAGSGSLFTKRKGTCCSKVVPISRRQWNLITVYFFPPQWYSDTFVYSSNLGSLVKDWQSRHYFLSFCCTSRRKCFSGLFWTKDTIKFCAALIYTDCNYCSLPSAGLCYKTQLMRSRLTKWNVCFSVSGTNLCAVIISCCNLEMDFFQKKSSVSPIQRLLRFLGLRVAFQTFPWPRSHF